MGKKFPKRLAIPNNSNNIPIIGHLNTTITMPTMKQMVPRNLEGLVKYLKHLSGPIRTIVPATKSILPNVSIGLSNRSKTPRTRKTTPKVVRPRPISKSWGGWGVVVVVKDDGDDDGCCCGGVSGGVL